MMIEICPCCGRKKLPKWTNSRVQKAKDLQQAGKTQSEIAKELGTTVGAIAGLFHREARNAS